MKRCTHCDQTNPEPMYCAYGEWFHGPCLKEIDAEIEKWITTQPDVRILTDTELAAMAPEEIQSDRDPYGHLDRIDSRDDYALGSDDRTLKPRGV